MDYNKKPLRTVIYYHFPIFNTLACEYIKREIGRSDVSITSCQEYDRLCHDIKSGNVDIIFTEFYYIYKDIQYGTQKDLKALCELYNVKIMLFLKQTDSPLIKKIIQDGYDAVISIHDDMDEFRQALRTLLSTSGKKFVSKKLQNACRELLAHPLKTGLSSKEWEVIYLISQGFTLSEIAQKKNRAISTIATQKHTAMKKLNVSTNGELLKYAYLHGML